MAVLGLNLGRHLVGPEGKLRSEQQMALRTLRYDGKTEMQVCGRRK